jgi:hypothetical protein
MLKYLIPLKLTFEDGEEMFDVILVAKNYNEAVNTVKVLATELGAEGYNANIYQYVKQMSNDETILIPEIHN